MRSSTIFLIEIIFIKTLTIMRERIKKGYDAPMVELIEARVEKGFQTSGAATEPQPAGSTEGLTAGANSYGGSDFD
jgi:hypothetical protein